MELRNRSITQSVPGELEASFSCPAQILVIDRPNGAADILMDTVSRLSNRAITVVSANDQNCAVQAMDRCYFDLVVIGLEKDRPDHIALVPYILDHYPTLTVLVVGENIHHRSRDRALDFGAAEAITLPYRAREVKQLVRRILEHYLHPMC